MQSLVKRHIFICEVNYTGYTRQQYLIVKLATESGIYLCTEGCRQMVLLHYVAKLCSLT